MHHWLINPAVLGIAALSAALLCGAMLFVTKRPEEKMLMKFMAPLMAFLGLMFLFLPWHASTLQVVAYFVVGAAVFSAVLYVAAALYSAHVASGMSENYTP